MKKTILATVTGLILCSLSILDAAPNHPASDIPTKTEASNNEKYDLLERDQVDTTDIFAIPLDESEVEDEQQINFDENKDEFQLPHSR